VPVNKWRLRNPRLGMMLVAAAGPAINLVMAGVAAVLLGVLLLVYDNVSEPSLMARFLAGNLMNFITANIFLALFNLLPIPPFDGSHIVEGLLPRNIAPIYARFHKWGILAMILLVVVLPWLVPGFNPVASLLLPPYEWLASRFLALATGIAGA
jgi:Zn-dependent protease